MRQRKGQIDKIISTFPVLLLIVIALGIFLFLAYALSGGKGLIAKKHIVDSGIFDAISVRGESVSFAEGILRGKFAEAEIKALEERLSQDSQLSEGERQRLMQRQELLKDYMSAVRETVSLRGEKENLKLFGGKSSCFILLLPGDIELFTWKGRTTVPLMAEAKKQEKQQLFLRFEQGKRTPWDIEGKKGVLGYYEKDVLSQIPLSVMDDTLLRRYIIYFYYGKCLSEEELLA